MDEVNKSAHNVSAGHYHTITERYETGKQMRNKCPRSSHAKWVAPVNRPDPVALIIESDKGRLRKLIPVRHGRMAKSPFDFFRGSALIMAADLSGTPASGIYVQACGDAHLGNFGAFGTPERNVIFSINDLDETLPAPWEWDLKRLATSFVLACRNNNLDKDTAQKSVLSCVRSYRENMHLFSKMKTMELWDYSIGAEMLISKLKDPEVMHRGIKRLRKEQLRAITDDVYPQIIDGSGGSKLIQDQPPSIFHLEGHKPGYYEPEIRDALEMYIESLPPGFTSLLNRFEFKDMAMKVVGVGSVGITCIVALLMAGDDDPLFIQVKEARSSVLESFAGKSKFSNNGQRIVNGYHLMQPFSDKFLGWTAGKSGKHFYIRQLRDIKVSALVEKFGKKTMLDYADWCGHALALSHSRSADSAMLSGYMGKGDALDMAIAEFSFAYADQNEKDYAFFIHAIRSGKIKAVSG